MHIMTHSYNYKYLASCFHFKDNGYDIPPLKTKTISLTTDYLIIGAGALGMCFLDQLIDNSSSLEAIIVD